MWKLLLFLIIEFEMCFSLTLIQCLRKINYDLNDIECLAHIICTNIDAISLFQTYLVLSTERKP